MLSGASDDASAKTPDASVTKKADASVTKKRNVTTLAEYIKKPISVIHQERLKLFNDFNASNSSFATLFGQMTQSKANKKLFTEILAVTNPVVLLFESYTNANEAMIQFFKKQVLDLTQQVEGLRAAYNETRALNQTLREQLGESNDSVSALQEENAQLKEQLSALQQEYEKNSEDAEGLDLLIEQAVNPFDANYGGTRRRQRRRRGRKSRR